MEEFISCLVTGIMDAFEEFFSALTSPTTKFTLDAFFVSLGFLCVSLIAEVFDIFCFVSWPEATVCSVIMLCIVLIDSTTRTSIKQNLGKVKSAASRFSLPSNAENVEEEETVDEQGE